MEYEIDVEEGRDVVKSFDVDIASPLLVADVFDVAHDDIRDVCVVHVDDSVEYASDFSSSA